MSWGIAQWVLSRRGERARDSGERARPACRLGRPAQAHGRDARATRPGIRRPAQAAEASLAQPVRRQPPAVSRLPPAQCRQRETPWFFAARHRNGLRQRSPCGQSVSGGTPDTARETRALPEPARSTPAMREKKAAPAQPRTSALPEPVRSIPAEQSHFSSYFPLE
jgi:hypothetical protein